MSGIAELLLASEFPVSGSDLTRSTITDRLESLGAKIYYDHHASHIQQPSCVVVSSAVQVSNPEWQEAVRRSIPVIQRAEMLAELMRLKKGIAVAGSHGKTTTTSLLGQVLHSLDPTVVVGGRLQHWNASSLVGKGSTFIIEADESDRSFLKFSPVYSIVTNIDLEHLDNYRDLNDIKDCFVSFLNRTAFFGENWICADCENLQSIRPRLNKPTKTFGYAEDADIRITRVEWERTKSLFCLERKTGEDLGSFEIPVPGRHNILNATGAISLALSLGIGLTSLRRSLKNFVQADRRLQTHYRSERFAVVEDYAHHPTEIRAAMEGVSQMFPGFRKIVIFQPHRYTRTKALWDEFVGALGGLSDELYLLPIYAAHEAAIEGVSSDRLAADIGTRANLWGALPQASVFASECSVRQEPVVAVVLGAAPLTSFAKSLAFELESLASRSAVISKV